VSPTDRASLGPRGREIAPQSLLSAMRQRREIFQDEETNFIGENAEWLRASLEMYQ